MSTIPVVGLKNIGNICFINSAFQCLASLKSMQSFLTTQFGNIAEEQIFLRMVQNELYQLAEPSQENPRQLSHELLRYIYERILFDTFNTQQDVTDLLRGLFQVFKVWAPRTYANFQVTATTECYGSRRLDASWGLQLNVSELENSIDIGQMLSEAVFLETGQVCTCGQNRIHIYGDLPQCLAITVVKLKFNQALKKGFVRQSVQIKCEPTYKIQGLKYNMKAAVKYIGADYIGGGSVCSGLKKITCCDNKKAKRRGRLYREHINMRRDLLNFAQSRYLTQPTNVGMCPTLEKIEEKTSFDQVYQAPKELNTSVTSVEEQTGFKQVSSNEVEDLESSQDENLDKVTSNQEDLAIHKESEDELSSDEELMTIEEMEKKWKHETVAAEESLSDTSFTISVSSVSSIKENEVFWPKKDSSTVENSSTVEESSFTEPCSNLRSSSSSSGSNEEEQAIFQSKLRNNLPLADPAAGHYMSYVKRDEGFYYISDKDVSKVKVVETDDLYVLFYERK